ncbi:hypothetical protein U0070_008533 [Myodes glareolus]|uniref:Ribonuclease pancreatic n=1 Tax=Myodes glareolus TaxID=447135 RepID=A0AAW0HN22_MYOGA
MGSMGVKLLESRLCLLLLPPLVIMVASVQTPRGLTPSQWFEIQHVNNRPGLRCTAAMRGVNNYTRRCKDKNTFLHTSFAAVVDATLGLSPPLDGGSTSDSQRVRP